VNALNHNFHDATVADLFNCADFDTMATEARNRARKSDFDQHVVTDSLYIWIADDRDLDFQAPKGALVMASFDGRQHGQY